MLRDGACRGSYETLASALKPISGEVEVQERWNVLQCSDPPPFPPLSALPYLVQTDPRRRAALVACHAVVVVMLPPPLCVRA